jgi:hypothetical protein
VKLMKLIMAYLTQFKKRFFSRLLAMAFFRKERQSSPENHITNKIVSQDIIIGIHEVLTELQRVNDKHRCKMS